MHPTNRIFILWPTARISYFPIAHERWIRAAREPERITTTVAVDTQREANQLPDYSVSVIGRHRPGVACASYHLSSRLEALPDDIVMLCSDDFHPPDGWDEWIRKQLSAFNGCLVVRDGLQTGRIKKGRCVTLPIMTYDCLVRLNRVIYHPSYRHSYSDMELWFNLHEIQSLKNFRYVRYPLFEHRHWSIDKRKADEIDRSLGESYHLDRMNFHRRMRMPLVDRLKV